MSMSRVFLQCCILLFFCSLNFFLPIWTHIRFFYGLGYEIIFFRKRKCKKMKAVQCIWSLGRTFMMCSPASPVQSSLLKAGGFSPASQSSSACSCQSWSLPSDWVCLTLLWLISKGRTLTASCLGFLCGPKWKIYFTCCCLKSRNKT